MKRILEPELLDHLPPTDPRARRSRSDLQRLNRMMLHAELLASDMTASFRGTPQSIAEIGSGDGTLMLQIARRTGWKNVELLLVDQMNIVGPSTLADFQQLGWRVRVVTADVFAWAKEIAPPLDIIAANLFLHHFSDDDLRRLFLSLATRTRIFIAAETRRSRTALFASRLVGFLGCNAVTRNDAVLSVRAGFSSRDLSSLWPRDENWILEERCAMLFTHLFLAQRKDFAPPDKTLCTNQSQLSAAASRA